MEICPLVSMKKLEYLLGFDRVFLLSTADKAGRFYSSFDMRPKGSNKKWRHIDNPRDELREIQKRIYINILRKYPFPATMIGGVPGGSIIKNAAFHIGQKQVLALDLRNCFPSTSNLLVYKSYIKKLGCSPEIAGLLTRLTTFHFRIPQGAPTSAALANLVLLDLHSEVLEILRPASLNLTFYIDDIVVSGENVKPFIEPVIRLIQKHGYAVSTKKKKLMPANVSQKITGLIVNRKVNIPSIYVEDLRKNIVDKKAKSGLLENELKSFGGKINFVRQVNPALADKIEELIDTMDFVVNGNSNDDKNEYRNCRCAKRHKVAKGNRKN